MHEVIIGDETYPVGDESRIGKYARVSFESIRVGNLFMVLKPITRWLENNKTKEVPVGTIFRVTCKTKQMQREDQCRYSIYMQAPTLDADIANMSWSLLALNTDIITNALIQV